MEYSGVEPESELSVQFRDLGVYSELVVLTEHRTGIITFQGFSEQEPRLIKSQVTHHPLISVDDVEVTSFPVSHQPAFLTKGVLILFAVKATHLWALIRVDFLTTRGALSFPAFQSFALA